VKARLHIGKSDPQTSKFVFTTLHTVDGSDGAQVAAASGVPFGWKATGTYTIKAVTDNGFTAEAPYTSPSAHE